MEVPATLHSFLFHSKTSVVLFLPLPATLFSCCLDFFSPAFSQMEFLCILQISLFSLDLHCTALVPAHMHLLGGISWKYYRFLISLSHSGDLSTCIFCCFWVYTWTHLEVGGGCHCTPGILTCLHSPLRQTLRAARLGGTLSLEEACFLHCTAFSL